MKKGNVGLIFISLTVLIIAGTYIFFPQNIRVQYDDSINKFTTCQQLENFVKTKAELSRSWGVGVLRDFGAPMMQTAVAESATAGAEVSAEDYSTTNIQVAGVDEADIVKNDGKYIYTVSGNKIVIVDGYPVESASILSEIDVNGTPQEMFINGNKLIIFGQKAYTYYKTYEDVEIMPRPYYSQQMFIKVYDVSDRSDPVVARDILFDGSYFNSRMIGDYAYVLIKSQLPYEPDDIEMPEIQEDGVAKPACGCADVYYFDYPDNSYSITTILSVNTQNDEQEVESKNFLLGSAQNIFVSPHNIYVTYTRGTYGIVPLPEEGSSVPSEKTVIHKISIENGNINYEQGGEVPGRVLNQFSMDENNGYFRIATTIGRVSRMSGSTTSTNNVYILNEALNIVGKVEDLAPGEQIYSARFMGNRAYLVTFRKIDPLFVIDLTEPANPKVLGKLKIPGYSDYLHPYDENHIIGIGKEAIGAEEGDFAWYQGVKLSLFDVTDVTKPIELSKYEIGDRGTDSNALHDHKAFLFSKSKGIIVIPITLAEINEEQYPEGVPPYQHGSFVWQGAYVLNIDLVNGITLRGRVTHLDDEEYFLKSGYYFYTPYSVKRSLYMEDNLYTLSNKMIKMNNLNTLDEVNKIELPYEEDVYYPEPYLVR